MSTTMGLFLTLQFIKAPVASKANASSFGMQPS